MKKYEYKFAQIEAKLGFNYALKIAQIEKQWNELGSQGWQFCHAGDSVLVFMREVEADE